MAQFDAPWQREAATIEGWLADSEARTLYRLAKRCTGRGAIVEIGSWKGRSTIWLAKGSEAGAGVPVYAVDPHTGITADHPEGTQSTLNAFRENLRRANCESRVIPLVMNSVEAASKFEKPVELVFIDGAHHEHMVQQDFELWFPKLVEGGFIAMHDTILWSGPKRVAYRMVYRNHLCRNVRFMHSLTYAQKSSIGLFGDRITSEAVLWAKRLYELLYVLNSSKWARRY